MKFHTPSLAGVGEYIESDEVAAVLTGGITGSVVGGLLMQILSMDSIRTLGGLVGTESLNGGWFALLPLGVLLAIPFAAFVSGSINGFVNEIIMLSSRHPALQKALVPLLNRSALAVTTSSLGAVYGVTVGVVFYLLLVPAWLAVGTGSSIAVPYLTVPGLVGVVGWLLYGTMLGLTYGLFMEA